MVHASVRTQRVVQDHDGPPETNDMCILLKKDKNPKSFRRQIVLITGLKPHRYTNKRRMQHPHKSVVT